MTSFCKGFSKVCQYKKLADTEPTNKKLADTEPTAKCQHWILALLAGAYVIAVPAIIFSGYAMTSVRNLSSGDGNALKFPSNSSRADDHATQRNYALHPNDTEAERIREQISSLNNQLEALKHHIVEMNATMQALNLEVADTHVKEDVAAARISNLTEQNGEASATFAKMMASMEAFKLEVSSIRAKESETASMVSILLKQVETLNRRVSDTDAKVKANVQRTDDLGIKVNAIDQRTTDLESKRTATNHSNSRFGPLKESAAVTLSILFLCLYYLCE